MSAAREQIRVALEGQKDGLMRSEIFPKCTATKNSLKSALAAMLKSGEVEGKAGESPHKTRYVLTGTQASGADATRRRQRRREKHGRKARSTRRATAHRATSPRHAGLLPTLTADSRLVLIRPRGPAQIFGEQDTNAIAQLLLANFTAD